MESSAAEGSRATRAAPSEALVRVLAKPRRRDLFFAYLREYYSPRVAWLWIVFGGVLAGVAASAFPPGGIVLFPLVWAILCAVFTPWLLAWGASSFHPATRLPRSGQICVLSETAFVFDTELGSMQLPEKSLRRFRETKHTFVLGSFSTRLVVVPKKDFASTADAERFAAGITRLGS